MAYPKFKDKHKFETIVYVDHEKTKLPSNFPKKFIIFYSKNLLKYIRKRYKPKKIRELDHESFEFYQYKNIGFVKIKGIGSPVSVIALEHLIKWGGKTFLNIGYAGGLKEEGIFLCTKALRDEGTSYHYLPHGHFTFPDKELTNKLEKYLKKNKLYYKKGITWTIDAPYRETREEINYFKKIGISTVEMESSALFALAKIRKAKIASAFVVSDTFVDGWKPKFHKKNIKQSLYTLFDTAVDCLK
jgi:uridine phosphorylase